jgi:hypothetical protein
MGRARRTHLQSDGGEIPVLTGNYREFFWKSPVRSKNTVPNQILAGEFPSQPNGNFACRNRELFAANRELSG